MLWKALPHSAHLNLAAVDLLVHCERGVAGEGLAAPALVWLLATVDAEVASEVRALVEGLATLRAEKGLVARASALVLHEVGAPGEGLVALVVLAGLVAVPAQVQCQS